MISTLTAFFCFLSTSTKINKEILEPLRFDMSKALHLTSKNSYKYLTCLQLYKTTKSVYQIILIKCVPGREKGIQDVNQIKTSPKYPFEKFSEKLVI